MKVLATFFSTPESVPTTSSLSQSVPRAWHEHAVPDFVLDFNMLQE